jgi:hypothetical protein
VGRVGQLLRRTCVDAGCGVKPFGGCRSRER